MQLKHKGQQTRQGTSTTLRTRSLFRNVPLVDFKSMMYGLLTSAETRNRWYSQRAEQTALAQQQKRKHTNTHTLPKPLPNHDAVANLIFPFGRHLHLSVLQDRVLA